MDGFKNIDIRNFRGIEHLRIDDFTRVNVFLGHNNSGKSSVLGLIKLYEMLEEHSESKKLETKRDR